MGALAHCDDGVDVLVSADDRTREGEGQEGHFDTRDIETCAIDSTAAIGTDTARREDIEFRSRLTRIRERVYLYAGKKLALVHDFPEGEAERLPRGVIVGSVEIVDCHEDEEGFAWELARPVRYFRPLVPHGVPQPGFWYPTF